MQIYLAGTSVSKPSSTNLIARLFKNKLHSYYHCLPKGFEEGWFKLNMQNKKVCLFLDSGAFSAHTQGIKIDIDEYAAFIKKNKKYIDHYANLDVIGDAEASLKNQKYLEKLGLKPIPVFHYGEDISYLKYYIKNYAYLGIGGTVSVSRIDRRKWLDMLFSQYLCDQKTGLPKVKIHGFGLSSFSLMLRYPWYSVDSTTWVKAGSVGSIFVPKYKQGRWIYSEDAHKITVSLKSPSLKEHGKHYNTLSKEEQKIIRLYLKEKGYKLGKSTFDSEGKEKILERGLCNDYIQRDMLNITYFTDLEKMFPKWPWSFKLNHQKTGWQL